MPFIDPKSPGCFWTTAQQPIRAAALLVLIQAVSLAACTATGGNRLPELTAATNQGEDQRCESVFPYGHWQFAHALDFSRADGTGSTVIGVTEIDNNSMACALTTVEGFTLFAAVYHQKNGLAVQRAVPPFDKPAFAQGLMADVRTIFLAPPAAGLRYGHTANGLPTCRFIWADGRISDIQPAVDGCWKIQTYTPEQTLERSIIGRSCRKEGDTLIPEYLELQGFGQNEYTLKMTLIQAENLQENIQP
jgi:hypothetical protein